MARVFKHRYADGHTSPKWYIEYRDASGKLRRRAGFMDRRATEQEAARLEREAEQIRAGLLPVQTPQLSRGITQHIDEYRDSLLVGGCSDLHASVVHARLLRVADGCGWLLLSDMSPDSARAWLNTLANGRPGGRTISPQTISHYLTHLCAFGAWCVPARLAANPFHRVEKPQASTDRRHIRRVISPAEFRRLIDTTRASKSVYRNIDGPARAVLYLIAAYTGLRSRECQQLRREDVTLTGAPQITLDGRHTKNGEAAVIPLPVWVADEIAPWVATRAGLLWPHSWGAHRSGVSVLRRDLRKAAIPYRDASGRVFDFHALRCYYAVELLLSGVPLVVVQKLMRHSDPALTANIYAQLGLGNLVDEVGKMRRAG